MDKKYRLCAMNMGSTSTKVAVFENEKMTFSVNVAHDARKLDEFNEIVDQLPYRKETILQELARQNISLEGMDAFIGSGGGLVSLEGGTYEVNETLLHHARIGFTTVYRTLKLLAECGLASEVAFHDGIARFEHQYNRRSHHHMVCTECGGSVEFFSPEVDRLEQEIGRKHHYATTRHTFQIYGVCEDCRKKHEIT